MKYDVPSTGRVPVITLLSNPHHMGNCGVNIPFATPLINGCHKIVVLLSNFTLLIPADKIATHGILALAWGALPRPPFRRKTPSMTCDTTLPTWIIAVPQHFLSLSSRTPAQNPQILHRIPALQSLAAVSGLLCEHIPQNCTRKVQFWR